MTQRFSRPLYCLLLAGLVTTHASSFVNPSPRGKSWAPCAFAAEQLAIEGNGTTYGSCLACDPTNFGCPPKCQSLIDILYKQCDDVYAPQDQYFDPGRTLNGYWNDNLNALRDQAARCGCSDATLVWTTHVCLVQMLFAIISIALAAEVNTGGDW